MTKKEIGLSFLYIIFSFILPIVIIYLQFDIYKINKLTIWGIICLLIASFGIYKITNYIIEAFGVKFWTKCIKGFIGIIMPLLLILLFVDFASNNIELMRKVLVQIILSVSIGIMVNPFPVWIEKKKEEKQINIVRKGLR